MREQAAKRGRERAVWNKGLKGTYHTGTSGMKGKHHSEKTKKKMSDSRKDFLRKKEIEK